MPESNRYQEVIAKVEASIETAKLFIIKYGTKIPEDVGSFSIHVEYPFFTVNLEYGQDDENRDRILQLFGDVFGRTGWQATLEYRGRHFDWTKIVDGTHIAIYCAQKMGQPEKFPVDPRLFPIQIEESFLY